MFPSILAILALPSAHAVENATELAIALQAACANTVQAEVTITLPRNLRLEPNEVVVYPHDPLACAANPPAIRFEPNPGETRGGVSLQPQAGGGIFTLFSFVNGTSATFKNIDLTGPLSGELGTEDPENPGVYTPEVYTPECAAFGGLVRGILIDNESVGGSVRGRLTLENSKFKCLNAGGAGAAVLAQDAIVEVYNSTFQFNSANTFGGAISVTGTQFTAFNNSVALSINDSRFTRNSALLGGAVSNDWAEMSTEVFNSKLERNFGALGAGGIDLIDQRNVVMKRNEFDRQNPTNLDIVQEGGSVRIDSGGLYDPLIPPTELERGALDFSNNILCGSLAGRGGGLFINAMPNVNIENSVFAENVGLDLGGGLYVENEDASFQSDVNIIHNTFVGNLAGRTPDFIQPQIVYTIGGGAAAAFQGVNPVFRNNIVAYSEFGGGLFVDYEPFTSSGYQIGDAVSFYNNLWFENDDGNQMAHLTGDVANLPMNPSNVIDMDPQLSYLGLGEYNCVPDAFYPLLSSPAVNAGGGAPAVGGSVPTQCQDWVDIDVPSDFQTNQPLEGDPACDIGAFGGVNAMWSRDIDLDGYSSIFDCDDNNPDINPGAAEVCDNADNDCDGEIDEGILSTWYPDADQDGYGQVGAQGIFSCGNVPGHVASPNSDAINTDCDDENPLTHPGATEICDGEDNNCNLAIDDGLDFNLYYNDDDGDGFGANGGSDGVEYCEPPQLGQITSDGDCNDANPDINPGRIELCGNEIDDDCNGMIDAADPNALANGFYPDYDGDGDGAANATLTLTCDSTAPPGFSLTNGDCNDAAAEINSTTAIELCGTAVDEDCDGQIDEADANSDATRFYVDSDADGLGNAAAPPIYECGGVELPGRVLNADDCNDADPLVGECKTGGCSSTGTQAGTFGLMLGMLALGARRRRD